MTRKKLTQKHDLSCKISELLVVNDTCKLFVSEMTVIYVTARTLESQLAAKEQLDLIRQTTDETLHYLKYWPGIDEDGHMYQSPYLFSAVLDHHRNLVKVRNRYQSALFQVANVQGGFL